MKTFIIAALLIVTFAACKKSKNSGCAKDMATISGSYRITGYSYRPTPSSAEIDYYAILFPDPCERDNILKFNSNGTYELIDANIVCTPPVGDNGNWSLSGDQMIVDGDAALIESFDCSTLKLVVTDSQQNGDWMRITLVKQ